MPQMSNINWNFNCLKIVLALFLALSVSHFKKNIKPKNKKNLTKINYFKMI